VGILNCKIGALGDLSPTGGKKFTFRGELKLAGKGSKRAGFGGTQLPARRPGEKRAGKKKIVDAQRVIKTLLYC